MQGRLHCLEIDALSLTFKQGVMGTIKALLRGQLLPMHLSVSGLRIMLREGAPKHSKIKAAAAASQWG